MSQEIKLPELGDGIDGGVIVSLNFKEGDEIKQGETVAEIETDKAVLGIPSTLDGKLTKWNIKEGQQVKVGDPIFSIEETGASEESTSSPATSSELSEPSEPDTKKEAKTSKEDAPKPSNQKSASSTQEIIIKDLGDQIEKGVVVSLNVNLGDEINEGSTLFEIETDKAVTGYPSPLQGKIKEIYLKEGEEVSVGAKAFLIESEGKTETKSETAETTSPSTPNKDEEKSEKVAPEKQSTPEPVQESAPSPSLEGESQSNYHAGPAARKLAREIGVNLGQVSGSGRSSRILVEDVKKHAKSIMSNIQSGGGATPNLGSKELPDFSTWGEINKEKASNLRNTIAQHISYSWNTIPHVHQFDNFDISHIIALQKKWKEEFEKKDSVLSVTPFVIKALAQCLKDYPVFNSSYDPVQKEIIYKKYFNIGVAVDTPDGLIVPVIKGVDKLSIFDIGKQLKLIAAQTRERKIKPDDLKGSSITLSNLGGIGGSHFNPIVNWPEVAILGIGRGEMKPVFDKQDNSFHPKMILPACLAYDHRIIDGAQGARFIVSLKKYIENPDLLLIGL